MTPTHARRMAARAWANAKHAWKCSKLRAHGRRALTPEDRVWWRQAARDDYDRAMGWMESARKLEAGR